MQYAEVCKVCTSGSTCGCRAAFTRYAALLVNVATRVSTVQRTSAEIGIRATSACVDKLNAILCPALPRTRIESCLRSVGIPFKLARLKDRRWYLQIARPEDGIYLRVSNGDVSICTNLVSRPSAFTRFRDYLEILGRFLPLETIRQSVVTRLDLALDYPLPLKDLLSALDVPAKRLAATYLDTGAVRTGLMLGTAPEKIVIYDKALKSGTQGPLTRTEFQISGRRLPTRHILNIPECLSEKANWNPFTRLSLLEVALPDELPEGPKVRLAEFATALDRDGYLRARREFNKQGNFDRDVRRWGKVRHWGEQPSAAFRRLIAPYLY